MKGLYHDRFPVFDRLDSDRALLKTIRWWICWTTDSQRFIDFATIFLGVILQNLADLHKTTTSSSALIYRLIIRKDVVHHCPRCLRVLATRSRVLLPKISDEVPFLGKKLSDDAWMILWWTMIIHSLKQTQHLKMGTWKWKMKFPFWDKRPTFIGRHVSFRQGNGSNGHLEIIISYVRSSYSKLW